MAKYNTHAGHNKKVPGASKYLDEVTENRKVNNLFIQYMEKAGNTMYNCTDDNGKTQGDNLYNIVKKCNAHDVKLDVSWHLNANKDTDEPMGVEACIYDDRVREIAEKIVENISKALGIPNRGVKIRKDLYVLRNTNDLAILIECCFVDSKSDAEKWNADKCAKATAEAICGKTITLEVCEKPKFLLQCYRNDAWGINVGAGYTCGKKGYNIKAFRINATCADGEPYVVYRVREIGEKEYKEWHYDRGIGKNGFNHAGDKIHSHDRIQMHLVGAPGWEIAYRVYVKGEGWQPWVVGYNNIDFNGYGGIDGKAIQMIQVKPVRV